MQGQCIATTVSKNAEPKRETSGSWIQRRNPVLVGVKSCFWGQLTETRQIVVDVHSSGWTILEVIFSVISHLWGQLTDISKNMLPNTRAVYPFRM